LTSSIYEKLVLFIVHRDKFARFQSVEHLPNVFFPHSFFFFHPSKLEVLHMSCANAVATAVLNITPSIHFHFHFHFHPRAHPKLARQVGIQD
jgi:hypothetical protein